MSDFQGFLLFPQTALRICPIFCIVVEGNGAHYLSQTAFLKRFWITYHRGSSVKECCFVGIFSKIVLRLVHSCLLVRLVFLGHLYEFTFHLSLVYLPRASGYAYFFGRLRRHPTPVVFICLINFRITSCKRANILHGNRV